MFKIRQMFRWVLVCTDPKIFAEAVRCKELDKGQLANPPFLKARAPWATYALPCTCGTTSPKTQPAALIFNSLNCLQGVCCIAASYSQAYMRRARGAKEQRHEC